MIFNPSLRMTGLALLHISLTIYLTLGPATVVQVRSFGIGDLLPWFGLEELKSAGALITDSSDDEVVEFGTHRLIERAGFSYENYEALADDGYITQLIRIINPLADARYLKFPPIMIQHGQTANSRNFVMQSNSKHHPMRYPPFLDEEIEGDPPNPSSNRSLAFMLANNGYDVWLSSTRGVDDNNRGYTKLIPYKALAEGKNRRKNMTVGEDKLVVQRTRRSYWSFTLDDQIAHEMPSQIATILNVTGASKISLFGYSNTALTTFAMLSIRPDIAPFVDTYIAVAPVVYYSRLDGWFKWFMHEFMQLIPKHADGELFLNDMVAGFIRKIILRVCSPTQIRYTICKFGLDLLFGDSGQFRTNLELPFFGHLIRPTSWKCLAQHLQIVKSRKLAKFDYGPYENKRVYGSHKPPEYNLSMINEQVNIALISGEKDCWANPSTVDEIRERLPRKPILDIVIPDYNHLDLAAAFDVDVRVNLPLLRLLDERHAKLTRGQEWYSNPSEQHGSDLESLESTLETPPPPSVLNKAKSEQTKNQDSPTLLDPLGIIPSPFDEPVEVPSEVGSHATSNS